MHRDKQYQKHLRQKFKDAEALIKSGDVRGYSELIAHKIRVLLMDEVDTLLAYHYLNGFTVEVKVFEEANCPPTVRMFSRSRTIDRGSQD